MADIIKAIVGPVVGYLVGPIIHEGRYFFGVENKIKDLEKEKEELKSERDSLQDRVTQAKESGQIIEKRVEKWLNDVTNLLQEVGDLEQRMEADNSCYQGLCPTFKRYRLCKQIDEKMKAISEFKGKSNIQPFSHPAPLPGIQFESSENFIYFESTKVAYSQLMEALRDDCIYMIGVYGMGGCGKTTLVTEVGKVAEGLNLFDKVISFTVSQTENIRNIQGKLADMLNLKLEQESEEGRAQRIWVNLKEKERILIIVDDLWKKFELRHVGICLDNNYRGRWKVLITTRSQQVCNSMNCQEIVQLGLLSEDESWTLFKKHANIDDAMSSKSMNGVPQKLCEECKGLPIAIKAVGSSLKGKSNAEWQVALDSLKHFEATDDHMDEGLRDAFSCLKLSYDYLKNKEAELLFLICSMFLEDYEISIEDLFRYAIGLGLGGRLTLKLARSRIQAGINKLLDSCLLMHVEEREREFFHHEAEIECIFDATSYSNLLGSHQVEALIPLLIELELRDLTNLKEVCRGPPLHVLGFFEKLEYLSIFNCNQLHSIFPMECNLQNLKNLQIENWQGSNHVFGEVLFSMSVAQSLQQLVQLSILGFDALKHIIESGTEDGSNTSKEIIPAPRSSPFMMPNLQRFEIIACRKLTSLFPICCVEGLVKLEELTIETAPEMKYVFGECNHEDHSSHQYDNQIMLPNLKVLRLDDLENLVGMCPESYPPKWPSQLELTVENCPNLDGRFLVETNNSI